MAISTMEDIPMSAEILAAIEGGRKIEAIKLLRKEAGIGLKDAKEAVDYIMGHNPEIKEKYDANKGADVISQEGFLKFIVIVIGLFTAYWVLWK